MLLITHIVCALSSLVLTGYLFFRPSKSLLNVDYILAAVTVGTGVYLIWSAGSSHVVSGTISGLTYLALVLVGIVVVQRKLAHLHSNS
jgi:hypothetical protein